MYRRRRKKKKKNVLGGNLTEYNLIYGKTIDFLSISQLAFKQSWS
jgi:hypothetical protein